MEITSDMWDRAKHGKLTDNERKCLREAAQRCYRYLVSHDRFDRILLMNQKAKDEQKV